MAHGNLVRNYFACNAQAALLNPSLVKIKLSTKEALAYAALLSYWGCDTITPTWDALLSRSRLGKTALSAALDSLEVKRTLERRRFTDRTGRRHVIYFLNVEALFEKDIIEACGMEDDLYKHSIKEGASDSAVLARVRHLNTTGWKSTRFTTKQVKESLAPEEESSCGYDEDSLEGFLLSGFPDEMLVEEPAEEIYPREGMQPLFGDGADLEDDTQSAPEPASDSSDPWPTAATIPGGSEWAPDDTPSDTLIDIPVSQELVISTPKTPVKPKGNSEGECEKEFAEFYEIFPRHVGRKPAFEAWKKVLKAGKKTAAELIKAADDYAKYRAGKPKQYTLHPATWLNQERWADEYEEDNTGYGSGQYGSRMSPEEAAANRAAVSSTFMRTIRMWGFSSMEEYLEHEAAKEKIAREDEEKRYAEQAAILNPF